MFFLSPGMFKSIQHGRRAIKTHHFRLMTFIKWRILAWLSAVKSARQTTMSNFPRPTTAYRKPKWPSWHGCITSGEKKNSPKHLRSKQNCSYFCSVRLSSEGANNLLSQQYSSWTYLTPIRGHSPKGYVLSFSTSSSIRRFTVFLSDLANTSGFTTTALLLCTM